MKNICGVSLILGLAATVSMAAAGELSVKLTVTEAGGAERKAEPACGGVPLPWGVYKKDQQFAVLKDGAAIPAQVVPLVVDGKGYLRWVLVDTQLDVPAKGKVELTLSSAGAPKAPETPLKVESTGDGVTVDTGRIRFTIGKSAPFSLFSSVEAGGKKVAGGGEVSYTDISNTEDVKTCKAGAPKSIEVYDAGPMRATVKAAGRFEGDEQTKMQYIAWITCWAGQSRVHVKYILANSNPDQSTFRMIKESLISLKLAAGGDAAGSGGIVTGAGVSALDVFYQVQPRKVEVKGGALRLKGIGTREEADGGKVPFKSRNYLLMDSSHHSSQYVIDFAGGKLSAAAGRDPLHIVAPPEWYCETECFGAGKFGTQADELECYKTWKWDLGKYRLPEGPGERMWPAKGGRYLHGIDNHYESEQDSLEALLLMYVRSGGRNGFMVSARAWANFMMDRNVFRTDGWLYKDGAVWWNSGGPSWGNKHQRAKDPVTGLKSGAPSAWRSKKSKALGQMAMGAGDFKEIDWLSDSKQCYCHCYASGLAMWFSLTGERDALEAAVDAVEKNYDSQVRSKGAVPGKKNSFARDFTRSCYLTAAVRMVVPTDEFVVKADDHLMEVYLKRPKPELRGLVTPAATSKKWGDGKDKVEKLTAGKGAAKLKELGITMNKFTLTDKEGHSWEMVVSPASWQYTYLSPALECSYRQTGNEDVMDQCIAYGQAVSKLIFQEKHFNLAYSGMLVDFPTRGFAWDQASWACGPDSKYGSGVKINGYLARFHPDIAARAYSLTGEKMLKQRAYDYWWGGSHRGYNKTEMHALGGIGTGINVTGLHSESVITTARTFYEWSHPRKDEEAPAAVKDLNVTVNGDKATVTFTAPADAGGGKVVRYQVKCSDRKIADYDGFMKIYNEFGEKEHCNWFLAKNVDGEPAPGAPGAKESFTVTGVPAGAKFFAVRAFDGSSNRSAISNVSSGGQ